VLAGHGLTYRNIDAIAGINEIEELNIGHSIIARASLVGLESAVREMAELMRKPRRLPTVPR
ncbi:MAG TPA: pyridoxine 5'-phosphate synthase, partial [Thermoanaerobaculia bacterium]